ncbi:DUF1295 domain-containing protein [Streptomyces sp. NPDC048172]|uniref:DUF1295 domain-containing protein n=1 Tax=Streptomyces sp. NPDC048172 TaxID=3365505 RepID=UPI003717E086
MTGGPATGLTGGVDWEACAAHLGVCAGVALGVMLVTFCFGAARGRHRYVDVAWGLAFTAVAVTSCALSAGHGDPGRRALITALTATWGLRLAAHLARRGWGKGEDPRYARMLGRSSGPPALAALRTVYLLQGALVWLISLPVQAGQYAHEPPGVLAWGGVAVWLAGMVFEAVGDRQLARFTARPENRGRIMDQGLWSWTRHPNYFGDFCVWWGLYLVAVADAAGALVLLAAPLTMSGLLTVGSGKRLLEQHMADRLGYAAYAARTSGFFPRRPRKRT